jgi:amino acid adenylation domain-containing protein
MPSNSTVERSRQWLNLNLAQQSVWLDAKLSGTSVYQLGGWARIEAPIDEAIVRQSVSLLMARHDGLRLRVDDELPRQWLEESVEPPVKTIDLETSFEEYVEEVFSRPMPLGDHPLFAIDLLRAPGGINYILWRFHHLIADSASVTVTLLHWFNAYDALTSDSPKELSPGSSFVQTIQSNAAYLESTAYQRDLAYWTNRFDPLPPQLIADMELRESGMTKVPAAEWILSGDRFTQLETNARAAKTTAQRALFALFTLMLGRRHGQTDLVSGLALHRRDAANRFTIGMLAGVIAMRCRFEPWWSLEECVQAFSEQMDEDLRHQRLPVDALSRELGATGAGRAGLFEAAMSYIPADRSTAASQSHGLPITTGVASTKEASPISLHAAELLTGGISIHITVNPDFVDPTEAATLLELLQAAVDRFVEDPAGARFEELPSLTSRERELTLADWNRTEAEFPTGTLDTLFAVQAKQTPGAIAIIARDGREITYEQLDEASTALARKLAAAGVQPERVVGVRMERSTETIIALLAILKAGGVYLPLDPAYPADRLDYMAKDAGAIFVIESLADWAASPDVELPVLAEDPNRLAYIIYTSGTTGLPKGVAVPHLPAVNLAFARRACHDPLGFGDRVLAAISVGFDVSIGQLILPLLCGATVAIAGEVKTMGAAEFWQLLASRQVTHINSVPSFFDSILADLPATGMPCLKRLMLGGEALSGALVGRIQQALPQVEVVNMYGPTEACIDATYHVATTADLPLAVLPIGVPLSNYKAYVFDEQLDPTGVGVSGELYLGGAGLARGYVNAPTLTEERFIEVRGERLYRTGDRARWRGDGRIEFLGRVDQQVKIRGFRVEPGEIAAALLDHPGVSQAVVIPRAHPSGGPVRLIGYFVPTANAIPDTASLRAHLAQRLPDYMVPSAFVAIAAIPLNANGKLDSKALPSPEATETEYVAPRSATEEVVTELYSAVLGLRRCGALDHFFELGGHSLLATSLVSKIQRLGVTLPLKAVFEAPVAADLAKRIDALLAGPESNTKIRTQARPAAIPLSFPQERLWFMDRLRQDSSYNIPVAFELTGNFDVDAARRAMQRITERHESLRTRIVLRDGRPEQEISEPGEIAFERVEIAQESELRSELSKLVTHRFDLSVDAPFVLRLFSLAPTRHVLAAVIHHAAFDGWSAGIFLSEFATLYRAFTQGKADPMPAPAMQYADFALWQREQNRDEGLAYWLQELQGAPATIELPSSVSGGAESQASGTTPVEIPAELHGALLKLANDNGASLFMVLHAAFALLLAKTSGQDDLVLGAVVANRTRAEFESVIGCFVNTLPLRTKIAAGESFEALLARVKDADMAAYAHQDVPFEQLVEALHPDRSLQQTPIFQVMLVLQNAPLPRMEMPGLALRAVEVEAETAKFDLTLSLAESDGALRGVFEFAKARFTPSDIDKLGAQLLRVLQAIVSDPAQEAVRVDLLDAAETALVVDEWNRTNADFPQGTLDSLFVEQAQTTPDAIAIVGLDGREWTYREADEESSQIARRLAARGVTTGSVVGVRMERSAETILALLAILKAGAVYLPLDPDYPADRLEFMVQDAGAALVLEQLPTGGPEADVVPSADPNRLAYIIYTSGTTGLPKGVAVTHAPAVNLAFARRACHDPLGPQDRVLAAISVGFDVSIGQLLLPLLCGATVVVSASVKSMGAREFWALLVQRGVTHINSVPSFFESILDVAPVAGELSLKRLMLGGEALSGALVRRIHTTLPGVEVVNMYGPTEACIDATYHVATTDDLDSPVLPIGRPLSNYRAYVLDTRLQPVGIGVTGELYLAGAGLARGYVNAPALTEERFLNDPFHGGEKMYRTGDLARWRADGRIEFLGRVDQQLKIRGFRVEPGEIEAKLRQQAGVREAAVVMSGSRLVAYYTGSQTPSKEALREALAASLPDYMVPAAFVRIDRLPLSANGKLDRKALPEPGADAFLARAYEAPQGETEERIAAVWMDVLKLERAGRHDNFFELGGHSLLAVTLIERMRKEGIQAEVRALFATPTIAGLASAADGAVADLAPANPIPQNCAAITTEMLPLARLTQAQIDQLVAAVPGGVANVQDIYPLSPLQEGILFQHLMSHTAADPYLTPFTLGFDSRERADRFLAALREAAARHDVLRTAMAWKGLDEPVQIVLKHVDLPVVECDTLPQGERLDLSKAPLMRAYVACEEGAWKVLLLTHHLILDHASMEILVGELRLLMSNPQAQLPPAPAYRNFIAQTRKGVTRAEHEQFFQEMLAGVDEPTAPFGLTDVQSAGAPSAEARLTLDLALQSKIREQARALGVTPASLFHFAWAAVLSNIASKPDVVFGTVLLGRMRSGADAANVVGMFINTLPVRLEIKETGIAESIRQTHDLLTRLLRHEHAPLALAQRASSVPAPAPLFSSLFNFRHSAPGEGADASWPGVEMLEASEQTNYPLAMAVDDLGAAKGFLLTALAQPGADPQLACQYLEAAIANLTDLLDRDPQAPAHTLETLPHSQLVLVTEGWNLTAAEFPQGTLEGLFAEQARKTPAAIAITGLDGVDVTYAELDRRSTAVARVLTSQGVKPEVVVGVRMVRSTDTIIALLAILKAGGVYLPLDPSYPEERLEFMAKDAGAAMVLRSLPDTVEEAVNLTEYNDPKRLAYIIYTSGTTGQPKGVAVPHTAAVNLAFARRAHHDPICKGDRVLAAISVGFDVSIGQLLLPLLSGATVVIAPDLKTLGTAEFWPLLVRERVTHINSVPSFFDSILDTAPATGLQLKRLMLGGEALSGALISRIHKQLPGVEVVNMYGPTEACIDATYHVANNEDLALPVLPIGRPLSNYTAYVLDSRFRPVGTGVIGELYLGGAGLARGYVNAPELTAKRFVTIRGERLYRTGDRARWRADGCIEFLGRVDQQVKIRGFRVEPGEITAALLEHPAVTQAVVIPLTRGSQTLLVAYVLHDAPDAAVLRMHLASRLPDYMIPAAFVAIDAIPINANGKLDVRALPSADTAFAAGVAPRNPIEETLHRLFTQVLGVEQVGVRDSFFDVGGDSLGAMRLVNAIQSEFGVEIPMRLLFERPTIEQLAHIAVSGDAETLQGCLIPIQPLGNKRPMFCIHPAGGHVLCYLPLSRELGPEQPLFGLQASGLNDGEPLASSIEEMAAKYVDAVIAQQPEGPYQLVGMSSGGLIAFEMARQIRERGGDVSMLTMFDTTVPGSSAETIFTEELLVQAMAGELGIPELHDPLTGSLAELVDKARQAGRLPAGFDLAQAERIAGVFRNTVRMHFAYEPRRWDGPLLVLRALKRFRDGDAVPDWSGHAPGVHTVDFDCGHSDFVSPGMAPAVAALLSPSHNH